MGTEVVIRIGAENPQVDDERHCLITVVNESSYNGRRYESKVLWTMLVHLIPHRCRPLRDSVC